MTTHYQTHQININIEDFNAIASGHLSFLPVTTLDNEEYRSGDFLVFRSSEPTQVNVRVVKEIGAIKSVGGYLVVSLL